MPVTTDDAGRRSVTVQTRVPGAPEAVWRAVATPTGVSSWFVPTTWETHPHGTPHTITSSFGPGMDSVATVTEWDPPRALVATTGDLGPDAPPVTSEWRVAPHDDGTCTVSVTHAVETDATDWDRTLEAWEGGWPGFFRILELYAAHFADQACAASQMSAFAPKPREAAWRALVDGLGLGPLESGARCAASAPGAPMLAGTAVLVGLDGHPEELLLRLDAPAPGIAHLFALDLGGQVMLSVRTFLYGDEAESVAAREAPVWDAWLAATFPAPATPEA